MNFTSLVEKFQGSVLALIDHPDYRPVLSSQQVNQSINDLKDDQGFNVIETGLDLSTQDILNLREQGINISLKISYSAPMSAAQHLGIFAGSTEFLAANGGVIKNIWDSYDRSSGQFTEQVPLISTTSGDFQPYSIEDFAVGAIHLLPMSGDSQMQMNSELYIDLSEAVYRQVEYVTDSESSPIALMIASSTSKGAEDQFIDRANANTFINSLQFKLDADFSNAEDLAANNFDGAAYLAEHPELLANPDAVKNPEQYYLNTGQALGHIAPRLNYRAAGLGIQYLLNNPELINGASSSPYDALSHYLTEGMRDGNPFTYNANNPGEDWLSGNAASPILDFSSLTANQTLNGDLLIGRDAAYQPTVGFYKVTGFDGTVLDENGQQVSPGDVNYAEIALRSSNLFDALTGLNADNNLASSQSVQFDANSGFLAPFARVNDGVDDNLFFAFADANQDGLSHFKMLAPNILGLEDIAGGGDLDYDDLLLGFSFDPIGVSVNQGALGVMADVWSWGQ